jgi:hypothetical protein
MYETHLKKVNPGVADIVYDVKDLFGYIDYLEDIVALV